MTGTREGGDPAAVGVLLVNLGTPDAPTPRAVRRYLREFLGDPYVVDLNRVLWWLLLNGVILPRRAPRSAALYRRVWTEEGSPLLVVSRRQARALQAELGPGFAVELGMRYGSPSLPEALERLRSRGVRRLVLLPLFPQESRTTTGSVVARVEELLARRPDAPALAVVRSFPKDSAYVRSVAEGLRAAAGPEGPGHVVLSFHGIPRRYAEAGDPYPSECRATASAVARELGLADSAWTLAFQSRFGREEWLRPYTDELVAELAAEHPRVTVACPGFVADCLETIDEIGRELAATFRAAGGRELVRVPCVNDSPGFVAALVSLVRAQVGAP